MRNLRACPFAAERSIWRSLTNAALMAIFRCVPIGDMLQIHLEAIFLTVMWQHNGTDRGLHEFSCNPFAQQESNKETDDGGQVDLWIVAEDVA